MPIIAAFAVPHPPLIVPEVGKGEEEAIKKTIDAYLSVAKQIAEIEPEVIIISSPHAVGYADYFHLSPGKGATGDFSQFRAPQVVIHADYDGELVKEISRLASLAHLQAGTGGEDDETLDHGTMVPLYFIGKFCQKFKIVRIGLSGLPNSENYALGQIIKKAVDSLGRRAVYVASGDLSHKLTKSGPYGYDKAGPAFDKEITKQFQDGDFLGFFRYGGASLEAAAECGLGSFQIMAGALDRTAVQPNLLSYEGPFGVGYGVASFVAKGADTKRDFGDQLRAESENELAERRSKEDPYVKLARAAVEAFVSAGKTIAVPKITPKELSGKKAGVFVSLHENGLLRGCIGTFQPCYESIASEIIHNGIEACSEDPRFDKVQPRELASLVYSVDVLGPVEPIKDTAQLDAKRYGVIVENGGRRGLLLPDLEGVKTPERQISIAKQKAGIGEDEAVSLSRFEAVRHL